MIARAKVEAEKPVSGWGALQNDVQDELDQAQRELKEIALMLEQSQIEVDRLVQRNASISGRLQQLQAQFDSVPRADIRTAYDAALESQQRLFVMRGQSDKLQSDQTHLSRYIKLLQRVSTLLQQGPPEPPNQAAKSAAATAEKLETMIQAQEAERQRLSQQMHDGPAQALSNFILQTEIAARLFDIDQKKARDELASLKVAATSTFQKVRDFIVELRPMMLDDLGLIPTLKRYVDAYKDQSGMELRLNVTGSEQRLEKYLEVMIFRAVQELLSNASRHSQASQVKIQVDIGDLDARVSIEDNGRGFNPETLAERSGMGLKLIKDRVDMLGGRFTVDSTLGQGTNITFYVPATRAAKVG